MATVRLFAAAAEAAGAEQVEVTARTVGEVRAALLATRGDEFARVLGQCAVVVGGRRAGDDQPVGDGTVDVLPPFAGG